jgi:pimeloyl-ACP methyl ester carboxylesterase
MPYARINKIDLYYETYGYGDPVLLIPGLGSDAGTWANFLPSVQDEYKLIILENRGSGRSAKPTGQYSIEMMAEDALALLENLGVPRAHVIGKSMGGMVAQILAARHPEKVRSLVLACTLMKHDDYGKEMLEIARILAQKGGLYETYRLAFLLSYSKEYCMTHRARLEQAQRFLKEASNPDELVRGYIGQSLACENHDSRDLAPQIKAPTLILVGREDRITTPEHSESLAAAIRQSQLVIFPHGGHGFWREFPKEVNPIVRDFLNVH